MRYENIIKGTYVERPNRFIAHVLINDIIEKVHVKNTGRCKELLLPGATVYLEDFKDRMGSRKLRFSLIAVEKNTPKGVVLINMDSHAPNKVVAEAMKKGRLHPCEMKELFQVKGEYKYGNSRLDFYGTDIDGNEFLAEVKGVTLEDGGVARFPDAPTERGVKHIEELIKSIEEGYKACIIFVIQMKGVSLFEPNDSTHPEFGSALRRAKAAGVEIMAWDCVVTPETLELDSPVSINLNQEF